MICSDKSGKLQKLDRDMAKTYSNLKAKLRSVLEKLCKVGLQISSLGKEYESLTNMWVGLGL